MNKRSSHAAKTIKDRSIYQKSLLTIDAEPTVDESLDFNSSVKVGTEEIKPVAKKKRPRKFLTVLKNVLVEYSIQTFLGILALGILYLVHDSRANFQIIQNDISSQQQRIDELSASIDANNILTTQRLQEIQNDVNNLEGRIKNTEDQNSNQEVLISEIKLRLEFILSRIND